MPEALPVPPSTHRLPAGWVREADGRLIRFGHRYLC